MKNKGSTISGRRRIFAIFHYFTFKSLDTRHRLLGRKFEAAHAWDCTNHIANDALGRKPEECNPHSPRILRFFVLLEGFALHVPIFKCGKFFDTIPRFFPMVAWLRDCPISSSKRAEASRAISSRLWHSASC